MNKCEELKIHHAWEDIQDSRVFSTHPPQYPNPKQRCLNCGEMRELITTQEERREWNKINQ